VFAVWWECAHPIPWWELGLLRERNFAFANIFYFLFGFVSLRQYDHDSRDPAKPLRLHTPPDAGLVLGPGALVITVLAPFVAILTQKGKVSPRWLIAFSFAVVLAVHAVLQRFHAADRLRALCPGACGTRVRICFFVCARQRAAYSYLPPGKNNKGSSLTNLAAIGVAVSESPSSPPCMSAAQTSTPTAWRKVLM